jgi:integrase
MKPKLYSWQVCPVCKKHFKRQSDYLLCPEHFTRPTHTYLKWYYQGEQFTTKPFTDQAAAIRAGVEIDNFINEGRFNPSKYIGEHRETKGHDFATQYDKWLSLRKKDFETDRIAPSYYEKLKQYAKKFNAFTWPTDIRTIKTYHITEYFYSMTESAKTQKNILAILKMFFEHLYRQDYLKDMPKFPEMPDVIEKEIIWIDHATQLKILQYIQPMDQPIFKFLFATGLRPAEVRALKWKDIDYEQNCIHITRGFSKGTLREITKTKRCWAIPLLRIIETTLKSVVRNLRSEHIFCYTDSKGRFYKTYGEKKLREVWHEACREAGVKDVTLYQGTRHSFASQHVNEGVNLADIGAMMGHTNTQTTKKYAHLDKLKRLKEVFD